MLNVTSRQVSEAVRRDCKAVISAVGSLLGLAHARLNNLIVHENTGSTVTILCATAT